MVKGHVLYFSQTIHVTLVYGPSVTCKYKGIKLSTSVFHWNTALGIVCWFFLEGEGMEKDSLPHSTDAVFCVWNLLIVPLNGCINVEAASSPPACSCIHLVGGVSCGGLLAASPAVVLLWGKVSGQMEARNNNWVYCAHKGSAVSCWIRVHMIGSTWQAVSWTSGELGCTALLVRPQRSWALVCGRWCFTRHPGKSVHGGIHLVKTWCFF